MLYEKSKELAQLSLQNWVSHEVFSLGWFVEVGILLAFYIVWFILLDKKRTVELLLIGSLAAVFYHLNLTILVNVLCWIHYSIRIFPMISPDFISGVTISPIILMLVQQYTSHWKGYILWSGVGIAFVNFIILPINMLVGILQFDHWNLIYHFIGLFVISLFTRYIFLWITETQKRHTANVDKK